MRKAEREAVLRSDNTPAWWERPKKEPTRKAKRSREQMMSRLAQEIAGEEISVQKAMYEGLEQIPKRKGK